MRRRKKKTRELVEDLIMRTRYTNNQIDNIVRRTDRIEWYVHNLQPNLREVLFSKPEQDLDKWYKDNKLNIERLANEGMA
jgi:hypothetical protein